MKLVRFSLLCGFTALTTLALPQAAQASVLITVLEVGPNVVATGSGTINTTALTFQGAQFAAASVLRSSSAILRTGLTGGVSVDNYSGYTGPSSFGSGGTIFASSGTGDMFGVLSSASLIQVPAGYVSSTALAGSATWASASFATLGVTPGTYTYTWGSGGNADSLTVQIGGSGGAAPEPGTLALLALGGLGILARRRRK